MNLLSSLHLKPKDDIQCLLTKSALFTGLATVCGYGGTFFFTYFNPRLGANYIGTTALISLVAYEVFESIKARVESPLMKHSVSVLQLLQIPFFFYFSHGIKATLTASMKLEIIMATAYFIAIPIFFHLAVKAWKDPSLSNLATVVGVMLSLANGLGSYGKAFK